MWEPTSHIVGLLGFILALVVFFWNVIRYINERKERATADLSLRWGPDLQGMNININQWSMIPASLRDSLSQPALELRIVNVGQVPIYLKEAALCSGDKSLRTGGVHKSTFQPAPPCESPLQPGQSRRFVLNLLSPGHLERLSSDLGTNVCVSISSAKGEIARLEGKQLRATLAQAARWARAYQRAQPRPPAPDKCDPPEH